MKQDTNNTVPQSCVMVRQPTSKQMDEYDEAVRLYNTEMSDARNRYDQDIRGAAHRYRDSVKKAQDALDVMRKRITGEKCLE